MFNDWKTEKTTAALVDEAQAMADKMAGAKPHFVESYAATAQVWAAHYLASGQDLHALAQWKPGAAKSFARAAQTKIAALRKQRAYDSSDGLAIWLHTARSVDEPRIAPPAREIWQHILNAGPNAASMAQDLLEEAGLPLGGKLSAPVGFGPDAPPPV